MKKIWILITTLIISALVINVISADNSYIEGPYTETNYTTSNKPTSSVMETNGLPIGGNNATRTTYFLGNQEIYTKLAGYPSGNYYMITVGISNATYENKTGVYSWYAINDNGNWQTPTAMAKTSFVSAENGAFRVYNSGIQILQTDNRANIPIYSTREQAIHAMNDGHWDSYQPVINYGALDINYSVNIASIGTKASGNNVDILTYSGFDTNGNDLRSKRIQIRALGGDYEAPDKTTLLGKTSENFQASIDNYTQIYSGIIIGTEEELRIKWQDVTDSLFPIMTPFYYGLFQENSVWYQYGWIYQARLLEPFEDTVLIDWQTIYQVTSSGVQNTQNITNSTSYNQTVQQTIQNINTLNNDTTNWYIENTEISNETYNQTYQQNIVNNVYNSIIGTPDDENQRKANDTQTVIDNAIDTENDYLNNLSTQLTDLQLNDITQNNGLMKALRWVREVHRETIEKTQYAEIVITIMFIGLITYLIGRRNG